MCYLADIADISVKMKILTKEKRKKKHLKTTEHNDGS